MTIKENILKDINNIGNPVLLNQIFEYLQILKQSNALKISNKDKILEGFSGTISNKEAENIKKIISEEFNKIEGDW